MKTRRIKGVIVIVILLIVAVCTLPWKRNIDTTITAVQWKLNEQDLTKNVDVKVKGTYNTYLFRKNSFNGEINIDGYGLSNNLELQTVYFKDGVGNLVYQDNENIMNFKRLGFLMCSSDFSELLIGVYSDDDLWKAEDGIVISGKATDYTDALEIAKKLAEKTDWLSKNNPFD